MTHRRVFTIIGALAVLIALSPLTASPTASAQTFAPCPTSASLIVSPPNPTAPTTVRVALAPPLNLQPGTSGDFTSYHLHYFIDTEPVAAGNTIPTGNPRIVHTHATSLDLGTLTAGQHVVTVVLGQLNHVACETRGTTVFTLATAQIGTPTPTPTPTAPVAPTATAAPVAPPKTGNAGVASTSGSGMAVVLVLAAAALLPVAARSVVRSR